MLRHTDQLDKRSDKTSVRKYIEILGRFASNCPNHSSFYDYEVPPPRESKGILSPVC